MKNDEEAFPTHHDGSSYGRDGNLIKPGVLKGGLTKREYFAAMAMQNLQNVLLRKSGEKALEDLKNKLNLPSGPDVIAQCAVRQADALIKALATLKNR